MDWELAFGLSWTPYEVEKAKRPKYLNTYMVIASTLQEEVRHHYYELVELGVKPEVKPGFCAELSWEIGGFPSAGFILKLYRNVAVRRTKGKKWWYEYEDRIFPVYYEWYCRLKRNKKRARELVMHFAEEANKALGVRRP